MKHRLRHTLFILLVLPWLAFTVCLGRAPGPELDPSLDDTLVGKFLRELGPQDVAAILNNPEHPTEPGLPVNDLLYLLDEISVPKMVEIIQGAGARNSLDLIYAIKRLGCNRPPAETPDTPRFDIPFSNQYSDCTTEDFNHLDVMVELVEGTKNIQQMVSLLNRENLVEEAFADPQEELDTAKRYLEKLAYMVVYLDSTEKLLSLVNGVTDARDVVFLIEQFDNDMTVPPFETQYLIDGSEMTDVAHLVTIIKNIDNSEKLYTIINGTRLDATDPENPTAAEDQAQVVFLRDKMAPLTRGEVTLTPVEREDWGLKLYTLINKVDNAVKMVDLLERLPAGNVDNLLAVIQNINSPADAAPDNNAVHTVATAVNNIGQIGKMADLVSLADPVKVADLINNVSVNSVTNDSGQPDPNAAGQKLANIINPISLNNSYRLADAINHVSNEDKVTGLANYMAVGNIHKLGELLNDVNNWQQNFNDWGNLANGNYPPVVKLLELSDDPVWTGGGADPTPERRNVIRTLGYTINNVADSGKMVALVDNVDTANLSSLLNDVAAGSQLADDLVTPDLLAAGKKMTNLIDQINQISDLVFVVNNVSNISQMVTLVNSLRISSTVKVAEIANGVSGSDCWVSAGCPNRSDATGMGKMVNIIDYVTNMTDVVTLIDGVDSTGGEKLSSLINTVTNSSNLVGVLNAVIADADVDMTTMITLLDGLGGPTDSQDDMPKLATVMENISAADDSAPLVTTPLDDAVLVARLLAPVNGTIGGVGVSNMITMLRDLSDVNAAGRLAYVLTNLNGTATGTTDLVYNDTVPNIGKREALVRVIIHGITYELANPDQDFPGLGPVHLAGMMNLTDPTKVTDLVSFMNSSNISDVVVAVGCGDKVANGPSHDFQTACNAIDQGWP